MTRLSGSIVRREINKEGTAQHWHGLAQRMAVFSDGSPQGSQWPIPPGHFFDYELQTTIEDAGTHFYHSHVGMQALTVAGSLVVEDCGPTPYHFDDERTLLWSDLFTETDQQMEADLTSVQFAWPGETRALLLNGQGISRRSEGSLQSPYPNCSLPVIDVDPGKQYRFRFIGATGLSLVSMAFEGHSNLSVVQVDGDQWTQPAPVDRIQVASGQRFDVLFPAKTEKQLADEGRTTYFLQFETRARPEIFRGYAVLRYRKSAPLPAFPDEPPVRIPLSTADWLEYQLQPLHPEPDGHPRLSEVTRRVTINSTQLIDPQSGLLMWRLADQSWTENAPVPLLVDIYKRGAKAIPDFKAAMANHGWDPTTRAFPAKVGEVLEIVLQNTGSLVDRSGQLDVHPFHAHGEHYYDVGSGPGLYDAEANEAKIVSLGYQPVRRDTTMLYRYSQVTEPGHPAGWRAWRVRVSQPGVWLVHCHTLQHMVMGKTPHSEAGMAERRGRKRRMKRGRTDVWTQACNLSG